MLVLCLFAVACVKSPQGTLTNDPAKPHHTASGFRNPHTEDSSSFFKFLKFILGRPRRHKRQYHLPRAENDPEFLRRNRTQTTLTWVGHATFLLQFRGANILTDPQFSERASPVSWIGGVKRLVPPGLALHQLPPIDVVLISHNHYDSLDKPSVIRLVELHGKNERPRWFVPLGLKTWFAGLGISNVVELDWWERADHQGFTIHAVPAQHWSQRIPFRRNDTLWAGWVVRHPEFNFYFAGDSGYSPDFKEIGHRLGPFKLAAIPIGAYEPRWFMKPMHVNPQEAVQVHQDVKSLFSVGMHWGTFPLTYEPPDEPPKRLAAARRSAGLTANEFAVMQHGETRILEAR